LSSTGPADLSGGQQAHHPNAEPHRWLHTAQGGRRTKKPRRSGARFHRRGLPLATTANHECNSTVGCTAQPPGPSPAYALKSPGGLRQLEKLTSGPPQSLQSLSYGHQQRASGGGRGRQTKAPPPGSGARWVHLMSCHTGLARSLRNAASPPPQRPTAPLVDGCGRNYSRPQKKPRSETGLSWSRLSDGACRRGAKSSAASRHPNAEPQSWLHSARGETLA
jgi:hypothetical protein